MKKIEFIVGIGDDSRGKLWKEKLTIDSALHICYPIDSRDEFVQLCECDIEFVATSYLAIVLEIYYPDNEAVAHLSSENKWLIGFPIYLTSKRNEFPFQRIWQMMFEKASEVAEHVPKDIVRVGFEAYRINATQSEENEIEMLNAFNDAYRRFGSTRNITL